MSRARIATPEFTPRPAAPRRRSKRGIEAEAKLLAAADKVFWSHGYAGCTIAQIIEESGLSVGSFYHQFSDKRELLDRAAQRLLEDFRATIGTLDISRARNGDLFTLFYRLSLAGRHLVAPRRGIYRATAELAQNDLKNYGPVAEIGPSVAVALNAVIADYADQMAAPPSAETVNHAVQLLSTCVLQAELGMSPLFPADLGAFAAVVAKGACGVLCYTGQTERPLAA